MNTLALTGHAAMRMAQRNIKMKDAELIMLIGTEVDDGFLVRAKDGLELEKLLFNLLKHIKRVRGKRLVTASGRIVTAYHSSESDQRRLLRNAKERNLYE
jgi:hypothetical protein